MSLLERTGVGRDVNRHYYTPAEVEDQLGRQVVSALLDALRVRCTHPAFAGTFDWEIQATRARMTWTAGRKSAELTFDVADFSYAMTVSTREDNYDVVSAAASMVHRGHSPVGRPV